MDESMIKPECCAREKTILEEISELKIEESTKERIMSKVEKLEKNYRNLVEECNKFYYSTQRLKQAIIMLSVMAAEKDERVVEDNV